MNVTTHHTQRGSSLFIILIAVALFAALSYALSQSNNSVAGLSAEKIRLLSSDVMDMGNKLSDSTARLRLKGIRNTQISFENSVVTGYANAACVSDACKVFLYSGGGLDWEIPVAEINTGLNWAYTGDLGIQNIGTTDADLVAILPNLSLPICNRINMMLGMYDATGSPPSLAGINANKFTGTYLAVPVPLSNASIAGRKSACIQFTGATGNAFSGLPATTFYAYYQVLEER